MSDNVKNEIIQSVMNVEYIPNLELKNYETCDVTSFPINNLAGIGSAVKPLAELIGKISAKGGSGIYYVNTGGKQMFESTGGFIGSLKGVGGTVGGGQARMTPIQFNPASLAAACTVIAIEHKINQITDAQKDIADFLLFQEQAKIKGNINTLIDILNNYKFNVDNEKYKNNSHILVQTIKNESEKSILLLESLIESKNDKKVGLHFNKKVDSFIKEAVNRLNDYQLGIYQFAFSSFLEIILLENFDENYIDAIMKKINAHKSKYDEINTNVKERIIALSKTSIQNKLVFGTAKASSGLGKLIEKTPIGKTQLDEKLIAKSEQLTISTEEHVNSKATILTDINCNLTKPFEKTIDTIKKIYTGNCSIAFDNENIYLDI